MDTRGNMTITHNLLSVYYMMYNAYQCQSFIMAIIKGWVTITIIMMLFSSFVHNYLCVIVINYVIVSTQ